MYSDMDIRIREDRGGRVTTQRHHADGVHVRRHACHRRTEGCSRVLEPLGIQDTPHGRGIALPVRLCVVYSAPRCCLSLTHADERPAVLPLCVQTPPTSRSG